MNIGWVREEEGRKRKPHKSVAMFQKFLSGALSFHTHNTGFVVQREEIGVITVHHQSIV